MCLLLSRTHYFPSLLTSWYLSDVTAICTCVACVKSFRLNNVNQTDRKNYSHVFKKEIIPWLCRHLIFVWIKNRLLIPKKSNHRTQLSLHFITLSPINHDFLCYPSVFSCFHIHFTPRNILSSRILFHKNPYNSVNYTIAVEMLFNWKLCICPFSRCNSIH